MQSPGSWRIGFSYSGVIKPGLQVPRPPASLRGLVGSSHSLQNTLPVVRRGPVGEGAQLQKERRNLGGGCDCASAACFESGCATLGTSHFALSLSAILRSVDSVSSRV